MVRLSFLEEALRMSSLRPSWMSASGINRLKTWRMLRRERQTERERERERDLYECGAQRGEREARNRVFICDGIVLEALLDLHALWILSTAQHSTGGEGRGERHEERNV
jgi:hypothetical protein